MSKSNKKQPDRLKDACRKERLRSDRHMVNKLLKEGRFDEVQDLEEEFTLEEDKHKT